MGLIWLDFFLIVFNLSSFEQRETHHNVLVIFNGKAKYSEHLINYFNLMISSNYFGRTKKLSNKF